MPFRKENSSLKEFNTFSVDAKARFIIRFPSKRELLTFANWQHLRTFPWLILGKGSNILFTQNYEGVIIIPEIKGIDIAEESTKGVLVSAGAGENWDDLVKYCVENNFYGLENLSWIPGSVGAAPVQNIGAYGVEVKDVIEAVEYLDLTNNTLQLITPAECKFGYRDSIFKHDLKNKAIITSVTFRLTKQANMLNTEYPALAKEIDKFGEKNLSNVRKAVIALRESKIPDYNKTGNAGSFFKNPILDDAKVKELLATFPDMPVYDVSPTRKKISAAWLIEQAGWKGKRIGDAGVSEKHALVLVNLGKADGKDIYELASKIKEAVRSDFGIVLETEVTIL